MTLTTARSRAFGAVAAVAALLALSACGGSDGGGGVASAGGETNPAAEDTADTAPLDEGAQALVFAECLRDNGVDMPDPAPGQQGLIDAFRVVFANYDQATIEQAMAACEDLLPQFAQMQDHSDKELELALAECLREQGLDVPDNLFGSGPLRFQEGIDEGELVAALEVCRDVVLGAGR
jgi:hypothetical protein